MEGNKKILIIPRHLVFVRFVDIPSTDDAEIKKMVELQAIKDIPHPRRDLITSCRNLGSYREGFSSIMLAAAKKETIENMIREKGADGFKVETIRLHSELSYLLLLKKGLIDRDKVDLVIHIGEKDSEVMILDKTRPIFSRGFKNSERFLDEISQSVLYYERDSKNPAIDNIIITYGANIDIEEAKLHIKEHFTRPVSFHEYSEDLDNIDLDAKIDLMPKEVSDKKVNLQKRQEKLVTYFLIGLTIILSLIYPYYKLYKKKKFSDALSSKINQIQFQVDRLEGFHKKTEVVKEHISRGGFIIDILKESYNLIPSNISVSALDYNGKSTISYKGTSKGMNAILSFVRILEKSKYFKKVEVKYATKKETMGKEFTDFNIQCLLALYD